MSTSTTTVPDPVRPVNVASVPKRSPFRYPGGKTWLVPYVRCWINSLRRKPRTFIEPFGGGGIISLTVAAEGLVDKVIIGEVDHAVAAVWHTILGPNVKWLVNRILTFDLTRTNVVRAISKHPGTIRELAFHTLLRNRVQHGGILAPGASLVKYGENGRGIRSRWYPATLANRINAIAALKDRIHFVEGDAFDLMKKFLHRKTTAFFLDPPYTAGGKRAGRRLYLHNKVDHARLFSVAAKAKGPVILTYDDTSEIRDLAKRHYYKIEPVPMKNTHHAVMYELVVSNVGSSLDARQ